MNAIFHRGQILERGLLLQHQVHIEHVGCKYDEEEPYWFSGQFDVIQGQERSNSTKLVITISGECNIL